LCRGSSRICSTHTRPGRTKPSSTRQHASWSACFRRTSPSMRATSMPTCAPLPPRCGSRRNSGLCLLAFGRGGGEAAPFCWREPEKRGGGEGGARQKRAGRTDRVPQRAGDYACQQGRDSGDEVEHPKGRAAQLLGRMVGDKGRQETLCEPHMQ